MKPGQDTYPKARDSPRRTHHGEEATDPARTLRQLQGGNQSRVNCKSSRTPPAGGIYEYPNPMPTEAAAQMERDPAEELRRAGYTVAGGH